MICKSLHFIVCIIAFVIVACCMANTDKEVTKTSSGTHYKYCGRTLVNVLTIICDSIYNGPKDGSKVKLPTDLDLSKFRLKRSVVDVFQRGDGRRFRRGAYDDCCRKGCTIEEIVGYCGA